jgi:subtilisin family serine protease
LFGHGTHVAGTIGSKSYGVAKNTRLFAMKTCNQYGSCDLSGVIAAINLTISDSATRGCTNGVVINMSLGALNTEWQSIRDIIKIATRKGIFISVAAGNDGRDARYYSPASAPGACVAGASDINDKMASFSNFGSTVSVFGPGVDILSTYNQGPNSTVCR